jgi:hypothetical protein
MRLRRRNARPSRSAATRSSPTTELFADIPERDFAFTVSSTRDTHHTGRAAVSCHPLA